MLIPVRTTGKGSRSVRVFTNAKSSVILTMNVDHSCMGAAGGRGDGVVLYNPETIEAWNAIVDIFEGTDDAVKAFEAAHKVPRANPNYANGFVGISYESFMEDLKQYQNEACPA